MLLIGKIGKEMIKLPEEYGLSVETPQTPEDIFYHLCFCLNAPQTTFAKNRNVLDVLIEVDFYNNHIETSDLEAMLRPVRFYRQKAQRLIRMKKQFPQILHMITAEYYASQKRRWIVDNIYGAGMKVASHFLRNMGETDLAIIDTHVLKFLKQKSPNSVYAYEHLECLFLDILPRLKPWDSSFYNQCAQSASDLVSSVS